MAWRYINPGYVHLLDKDAQATATQVTGYEYSKTGVGFYQSNYSKGVALKGFNESDNLWAKFDFYAPKASSGAWTIRIGFPKLRCYVNYYNYDCFLDISSSSNYITLSLVGWAGGTAYGIYDSSVSCSISNGDEGTINSVRLCVNYSQCYIDVYVNGVYIKQFTGFSCLGTSQIVKIYATELSPTSSWILSDEEINIKEQVIALPVSATETAMTLQSDTYIADGVGQTILQSVNVNSLIDEYGGDSKVTGIAIVGNPAYRTGEQLSSLTAISKRGGVITEHGTSNLSTASDTVICQGFSTASDTTIADLQNMQFGWKAGE